MVMLGQPELAIGLGVVTAAVLAYKQPLHGFVEKLGWDDIYAGVRLLIATFIALPLLPNEPIDPWGALNPYSLWLLVILISSLSLVGYVLTRLLGPARGTALTGLTGGLVSSTAVTLSFAKEGRDNPQQAPALACGILLAWAVMFVRVIVLVAVVNRSLLTHVIVPFAVMAAVVGGFAAYLYFRGDPVDGAAAKGTLKVQNPFSLTEAAKFAALFAVVLLAVKIVQQHFPPSGLYAVAALAGLTDVDAITLSMAEFAKAGEARVAVITIVIAALTNTLVKCGMAFFFAGPRARQAASHRYGGDARRGPRHGLSALRDGPWSLHIEPLALAHAPDLHFDFFPDFGAVGAAGQNSGGRIFSGASRRPPT